MPDGWTLVPSGVGDIVIGGPLAGGHRPTLTISREPFSPPTPEGLSRGLASVRAAQREEYDGFELLAEQALEIDGRSAYLEHFRWHHPTAELTQVLALVVIEPGVALQVDAVCLTDLEDEHLSAIDAIVRSITFPPVLAASA